MTACPLHGRDGLRLDSYIAIYQRSKNGGFSGIREAAIKPVWNRSLCVKISVCLSTLGKGMGKRLGYARVSTDDQRLDLQRDALTRAGCADIYEEKVSGKSADRPALDYCLRALSAGDTLVVWLSFSEGDCTRQRGLKAVVQSASERTVSGVHCTKRRERSELLRTPMHGATKVVRHKRRVDCPCAVRSATAFLSKETKVSPPSQLPS